MYRRESLLTQLLHPVRSILNEDYFELDGNHFQTLNKRCKYITAVTVYVLLMTATPIYVARCETSTLCVLPLAVRSKCHRQYKFEMSTKRVLIFGQKNILLSAAECTLYDKLCLYTFTLEHTKAHYKNKISFQYSTWRYQQHCMTE